jgi:site-specific recombinase XerD
VAIVATLLFTGIRFSECINLQIKHVDLESSQLFVECGKGQKDRIVPIHPLLKKYLEAYIKDRKRLKRKTGYFFCPVFRDDKMGVLVIPRLLKKIRERCGIYFSSHTLRHTFATLMLEGGCDIFTLSKMMGHEDIKTTTIYLSASVGHMRQSMARHPLYAMA